MAFLESELIPFVEENYNVSGRRTILGQSLGGLLATEILIKRPELFDRYVIISPSMWWDDGSILETRFDPEKLTGKSVYVGVGKEGKVMEKGARDLYRMLKKDESAQKG